MSETNSPVTVVTPRTGFDVAAIRKDFPILKRLVHGKRLVYLDNAATTQKPHLFLDMLCAYFNTMNANIHRGIHTLAEESTARYEESRRKVADFLGGADPRGVVFTRNATESINLVAQAWARPRMRAGDEILLTGMEHHSNLVPWILLARQAGVVLRHIPVRDDGHLDLDSLDRLLTAKTRLVSVMHASNVLGTINPVRRIADAAHRVGASVLVDGAQSVPHMPVSFADLGCDFLAFSAHKMLGPTGVGVLLARPETLEATEPFLGGGEMIREVHLDRATWNDVPWKFEAGTPNIAGVVAFASSLDYLSRLGMDAVRAHEVDLTRYALDRLRALGYLTIYGPADAESRGGVVAFNDSHIHSHDLSTILDRQGVAIRAGHHCAQPLMERLDVPSTARASFYVYNDKDDVDVLVEGLREARRYFKLPA